MMSVHETAGHGSLAIFVVFGVIPLLIVVAALTFDGRPHHQEIAVEALSAGNPLGGTPLRILIDQGATCDGDAYDLTADSRGVAGVSHAARLGVLTDREQSVSVCFPDEDEWVLAWSSHHESARANLSITCDVMDVSAPRCEAKFEK
ncbi:MAG: hypothetical protein GY725_26645 [bacterium]|nr:hypothetical protein [bacterium]